LAPTAALRELAGPALARVGLDLWDVEVSRQLVRFLVDRGEGVDLDALTDASRVVSAVLDEHDDLVPAGSYQLEVSSPGLERTLRRPDQFRRFVGSTVSIKTTEPVGGARRHRGTLLAADEAGCEVAPDAAADAPVRLSYDQIERARTVFEWGPAPKPGHGGPATSRRPVASAAGAPTDPKERPR